MEAQLLTLINADEQDEPEITDPQEVAEIFAAVSELMISVHGAEQARALLDAVIELGGSEPN